MAHDSTIFSFHRIQSSLLRACKRHVFLLDFGMRWSSKTAPLHERFWRFITRGSDDECWVWRGGRRTTGYGMMGGDRNTGKKVVSAHRVSWEIHNGPIPDGLIVCHTCEVKRCVNPAHVEPVTRQAHLLKSPRWPGNWTECKKGHSLSGENLVPSMLPVRTCRTCWNERAVRTAERMRADPKRRAARQAWEREWRRSRKRPAARRIVDDLREHQASVIGRGGALVDRGLDNARIC